jgi:3-oxoadipate enol-lactonase
MRVRGVELQVRSSGGDDGLPFFWGHGLMGSIAQEDAAAMLPWAALGDEVRLIRFDARGHGASEASPSPEAYRWSELAADLWALADALAVKRAVLGGVSMGTATALHAAVAAPERTRALVLMAPPTAWDSRPRQARIYRGSAKLVDWLGLAAFTRLGELASLAVSNKGLAAIQRSVMRELRGADPRAVTAALRGAALSDLPDPQRLAELAVPALILAWSDDPSHPVSTAEELARRLPNAELAVASDFDAIEGWGERLRGFLAGVAASPGRA